MRCLYREKKYTCGNYLDVYICPAYAPSKGKRKRAKETTEVQAALNQKIAEDKVTMILNTNFTDRDYELHLTYRDDCLPGSEDEVMNDLRNYLKRAKRVYKRFGIVLKYLYVVEGEAGKSRFHIHVTISGGVDRTELEKLWGFGYANCRTLQFDCNGVEGIAKYITKQYRKELESNSPRKKGRRRWSGSKNLIHPKPSVRTGKLSRKKVEELATVDSARRDAFERIYTGYTLSECRPFYNEINGGFYLHVKMYKTGIRFSNSKKRRE